MKHLREQRASIAFSILKATPIRGKEKVKIRVQWRLAMFLIFAIAPTIQSTL